MTELVISVNIDEVIATESLPKEEAISVNIVLLKRSLVTSGVAQYMIQIIGDVAALNPNGVCKVIDYYNAIKLLIGSTTSGKPLVHLNYSSSQGNTELTEDEIACIEEFGEGIGINFVLPKHL